MGIFDRLFGRKQPDAAPAEQTPAPAPAQQLAPSAPEAPPEPQPVAQESGEPGESVPLRLQVLFPKPPKLDGQAFIRTFERLHRSMLGAKLEVEEDAAGARGKAIWGRHIVEIFVRNHPMPKDAAERAIAPAHYRSDQKDQARAHGAYLLLNYRGSDPSPWNQYAALTAVASIFTRQGATTIANSDALTSVPASALQQIFGTTDAWGMLLAMPPAVLYCGFAKYNAPDGKGVWMRTHGCERLGLPDLAMLASDHSEGMRVVNLFNEVIGSVRQSNSAPTGGSTLELTPHVSVRFRDPNPGELFERERGHLLVLESMSVGDQPAITSI